jgi:hypothetical protein
MKQVELKAEKRERKKKPKMSVSGKSVFGIKGIIAKKAETKRRDGK